MKQKYRSNMAKLKSYSCEVKGQSEFDRGYLGAINWLNDLKLELDFENIKSYDIFMP
jgi:hypothetical protein